ncbi:MAG: tyrosine-type recombinase/integrase [Oscillospiraceae bacterium]|nr:tyrosine-type recombinase/integrase [Oscillospiraceae bacterium]
MRSRNVNQFLSGPSLCSQTPTLCAIVRNIGAPATRFHDLRHTFAVASIKSGDDVKTVQENLGHATAAFTLDVYGHFTDDMRSVSAQRMEGFITNVLNL